MLRSTDNPEVASFLKRERFVYTSYEIQNEILRLMAHSVLQSLIADTSKARIFSLIVDETTDRSTDEQVSVCFRYTDDEIQPREVFPGLYETADTKYTEESLFNVIKDAGLLSRFSLPVENLRGQCYDGIDGASSMSGQFKVVRARLQAIQPKALYVHCFAHSSNLCIQDAVRSVPLFRDIMQCLHNLSVVVRANAKRKQAFVDIAQAVDGGNPSLPRPLCPT